MASLRKFPGTKFYYCCYRDVDGKRRQVSTGQTNRDDAMRHCLSMQEAVQLAQKRKLTESKAREHITKLVESVCGSDIPFYSCSDWFKHWLAQAKETTSPHTYSRYKGFCDAFLSHLGAKADEGIDAIQPGDVQAFRDQHLKDGKTPQTANLALKCLSVPFNQAKRLGYLANNPCDAIKPLRTQKKDKAIFSPSQMESLLAKAEKDWRGVILLGYYTGARLSDITNLRGENLDFEMGVITYSQKKTGKHVRVPMHPVVRRCLKAIAPEKPKQPLFPTLEGRSVAGKSGLSSGFKQLMKVAGINVQTIRSAKGQGRTVSDLSFHSLRHTFNSNLANGGIPEEIRGRLTGHAQSGMNQIYTHIEHEQLTKAIKCLPKISLAGKKAA